MAQDKPDLDELFGAPELRDLQWQSPREVDTRYGRRGLLKAVTSPAATRHIAAHKRTLAKNGLSLGPDRITGQETVALWYDPFEIPDYIKALIPAPRIDPESLLDWSAPRTVTTSRGPSIARSAEPTAAFLEQWSDDGLRAEMSAAGITLGVYKNKPQVTWWSKATFDAAAEELSRKANVEAELLAPPDEEYLGFQRAGIVYALEHKRVIIGDEMGLGKTIEAIGVINNAPEVERVLVVSPASARRNWMRETSAWRVDNAPCILVEDGVPLPRTGPLTAFTTYSRLKGHLAVLEDAHFDAIVFDEAHYLKEGASQRTQASREVDAERLMFLSGTPMLNRPQELWEMLNRIDPDTWSSRSGFLKRYCGARSVPTGRIKPDGTRHTVLQATRATNTDELQQRMRSTCMIRRLKKDVLAELPPKRRSIVLAGEPPQNLQIEDEDLQALWTVVEHGFGAEQARFAEISRKLRALGKEKAPLVADILLQDLENIDKVVVFAHHRDVLDEIERRVAEAGIDSVKLTGSTPERRRQQMVDRFQSDPDCRVFIGSIQAAGVALTLTAARDVYFAELTWRPSDLLQAEDRCHRIGQENSVNIRYVARTGTLDEALCEMVVSKQSDIEKVLDVERTEEDPRPPPGGNIDIVPDIVPDDLEDAVRARLETLYALCDGVASNDGMGFSMITRGPGVRLLGKSYFQPRDFERGVWICRVHKKQLARHGMDCDELLEAHARWKQGAYAEAAPATEAPPMGAGI